MSDAGSSKSSGSEPCSPCPCDENGACPDGENCCLDERFPQAMCYPYFVSCTITTEPLPITPECQDFLDGLSFDSSDCCDGVALGFAPSALPDGENYICAQVFQGCSVEESTIVPPFPEIEGLAVVCPGDNPLP